MHTQSNEQMKNQTERERAAILPAPQAKKTVEKIALEIAQRVHLTAKRVDVDSSILLVFALNEIENAGNHALQ